MIKHSATIHRNVEWYSIAASIAPARQEDWNRNVVQTNELGETKGNSFEATRLYFEAFSVMAPTASLIAPGVSFSARSFSRPPLL